MRRYKSLSRRIMSLDVQLCTWFPVFTDLSLSTISLRTVTCIMALWVDQGLDGCALRKAVYTSANTCSGESRSFFHSMMLRSQGNCGRQRYGEESRQFPQERERPLSEFRAENEERKGKCLLLCSFIPHEPCTAATSALRWSPAHAYISKISKYPRILLGEF